MAKIAILADSTCDIPQEVAREKGIFVVPLRVVYKDRQYRDGVELQPAEMYNRLTEEIPTTSLPVGEDIMGIFDEIKAAGYDDVLCVHLSAGLSGTFNIVKIIAEERTDLTIKLVDTKNIAMGAGLVAIAAADFVTDGTKSLTEAFTYTENTAKKTKIFFTLATLEYLQKGGRMGLVSATIGEKLHIKPIISCNEEGIYHTITKALGRAQSLKKLMEQAEKFAQNGNEINLCVSHGVAQEEAEFLLETLKSKISNIKNIYFTGVGPVLGVHTGPGALGIGVQIL